MPSRRTMMLVAGGVGLGVLVAALRSARAAPARTKFSSAELSTGAWARVEGELEGGRYASCRGPELEPLPDSECALVLEEWPEIDVPITARIRMTAGRLL